MDGFLKRGPSQFGLKRLKLSKDGKACDCKAEVFNFVHAADP